MKYDERACKFNIDTGCVELLLRDGRKISIDCTGVEDALDVTMAQQTELDYLIYNDPLGYADLILNGDPEEYLKNAAGSHELEDAALCGSTLIHHMAVSTAKKRGLDGASPLDKEKHKALYYNKAIRT